MEARGGGGWALAPFPKIPKRLNAKIKLKEHPTLWSIMPFDHDGLTFARRYSNRKRRRELGFLMPTNHCIRVYSISPSKKGASAFARAGSIVTRSRD